MTVRPIFYVKSVFAVISLAVLFQFVPLSDIADVLSNADAAWFAIGLVLQFLVRAVGTLQMRVVAANQGMSLSLLQLYRILLTTQFYSLILPGTLAGGGVTWVKYVQHGADKSAAAAIVAINRAISLGMVIVLGACAWMVAGHSDRPVLIAVVISLVILATGITILLPTRRAEDARSPVNKSHIVKRLSEFVHRLFLFRHISRLGKLIIVVSALIHAILGATVILSFAFAVEVELNFSSVLWMRAALLIMLLLPITVAGIGVREVSLVGLGALIGVSSTAAVAWSFTILAGTVVVAVAGGLIEANTATLKVEDHLNKSGRRDVERRGSR